jgi:malonate-semialdehyde dehydrogenase (acetylating)/methylmalonate-semialdehyde dehydrogenase
MRRIDHVIAGGTGGISPARTADVFDPNTGAVQATALGGSDALERAVTAAQSAQPAWAATNPQRRARVMMAFKALVESHMDELAHLLSSEHGKVLADARATFSAALRLSSFAPAFPMR